MFYACFFMFIYITSIDFDVVVVVLIIVPTTALFTDNMRIENNGFGLEMVVRVTSNGSVDMFVYTDIEQFPCIFDIRICESAEHR